MSWYVPTVVFIGVAVYVGLGIAFASHQSLQEAYWDLRQRVQRKPTPEDFTTLLEACVDYRKAMSRAFVPDATSGPRGIDDICKRYGVTLDKQSLFGERP